MKQICYVLLACLMSVSMVHAQDSGDKPEVDEWLHSEEASPVLAQILLNVPCSETLH